jgi:hypothetical protein
MLFSKNNHPSGFYVYAYLREDGTPYYIGKGQNRRAWDKNHNVSLPRDAIDIVIIEHNLTELGSLAIERRLIRWYGRKHNDTGILRNFTDGGEGTTGRIASDETRRLIGKANSISLSGKTLSEDHRANMSLAHYGKPKSEQHRINIRKAKLGKNNPMYGKPLSEDHRAKLCDNTVHHFIHDDGREERLTQYNMAIKHGLNKGNLNNVIHGRVKSVKGWRLLT